MTPKQFLRCFTKAGYWTVEHDGLELAGYIAFLGLLSLFPFLVLFTAVTGELGEEAYTGLFLSNIIESLPDTFIAALKPRIEEILSGPPQGLLTVAIIGVLWTSSSIVEGLRTVLNRAYRVSNPPAYILRRLHSMLHVVLLTCILLFAMFLLVLAPVVWHYIEGLLNWQLQVGIEVTYLRYGISGMMVFMAVVASYYILPNISQNWVAVFPGAFLVMVGWLVAGGLLTEYLQNFNQLNVVYGSLGGVIVALVFFYLLAVVYIYGAEFNYYFRHMLGGSFEEKEREKE